MNEYKLYHNLNVIQDIARTYIPENSIVIEIEDILQQLSTKLYRVAVIGEFKRGKSSLINTLLGTEVLPTDILPATAVVNRIVYSPTQKIVIHYKDGTSEETTIDELHNYATKLDAAKEKTANTIREIIVHYPSYFCQNHIELLDTPGLNDDEVMTETTFEVLDKIDTALVVISATMPLSMTEQNLICNLIEQMDIYHLIFVVTFIDRVSDDAKEQDRIVDLLKDRIQNDTYEMFQKKHRDDKKLLNKAETILKSPDIFAVSSSQAMQGFIKDDDILIEKSRFEHFKLQLMALLTANQELDVNKKIRRILLDVKMGYSNWVAKKLETYDEDIFEYQRALDEIIQCKNSRYDALINSFQFLDDEIEEMGIELSNNNADSIMTSINPAQYFIEELSEINQDDFTPQRVILALKNAVETCNLKTNDYGKNLMQKIEKIMLEIENEIDNRNRICGIENSVLGQKDNIGFPLFELTIDTVLAGINNILGNIIPIIIETYKTAYSAYQSSIVKYIALWRASLLKQENQVKNSIEVTIENRKKAIENKLIQKNNYEIKANDGKNTVIELIRGIDDTI